jgi:hypothetical protein
MKKIILSAAVAAMAFSTSAMAADKGIDIQVNGQAVVYYETHDDNGAGDTSLFSKEDSVANVGVQLDLGADLGNNFTFGSQISYLGTLGLEKNLVNNTKQIGADFTAGSGTSTSTTDELMLSKIFIAKQIGNTTLKLGRQELPQSLSPLAFSEGWNVFKNTFDAVVAINTDIPKTTLVGAYVSGGTGMNLATTGNLAVGAAGEAYMLTAQTTVIPMTTLTASYYELSHVLGNNTPDGSTNDDWLGGKGGVEASAYWIDAQIKPMDMLTVGLQVAEISPDTLDDTKAWGAKVSATPIENLSVSLAYTDVNEGDDAVGVAMRNTGTNIKTALYTQMVYNQNAITLDAETIVGTVSYNMGDMGSVTVAYGDTDAGDNNQFGGDYQELDVIYKIKAGGVQYFAAYVNREVDNDGSMNAAAADASDDDRIRVWARYNF